MLESSTAFRGHTDAMCSPIHIVLAFDDQYWAPAYAVMRSVCLFTFRRKDMRFHIFHRAADGATIGGGSSRSSSEFGAELDFL